MSNQTKQKTPEFKKDAAKSVIEKGYMHEQPADSLDISLSALGRWVGAERGLASVSAEKKSVLNLTDQTELMRLRKEIEQLRMEREILKRRQSSLRQAQDRLCERSRVKYGFIRENFVH
jgi:transposase